MCLKVVIEDQVEDTKFAQETVKKNTFSAYTSIAARLKSDISQQKLETYYLLDRSLDTSLVDRC